MQNLGPEGELAIARMLQRNRDPHQLNATYADYGKAGVFTMGTALAVLLALVLIFTDYVWLPLLGMIVLPVLVGAFLLRQVWRREQRFDAALQESRARNGGRAHLGDH